MKRMNLALTISMTMLLVLPAYTPAASVEFVLLTDANNITLLPQPKGLLGVSGDYLVQTDDDITGGTFNPDGCFSFNFMNPVGISEPNYPPGYTEGIHSMTGSAILEMDLQAGGTVKIASLAFDGYISSTKSSTQWLIQPGDPATDCNTDGIPNSGTYSPSAASNWAFGASFDWYYDTPSAGMGNVDMTFDNYQWNGFIIPVGELTTEGMAATTLDDPLGYFAGTSADFESWLLNEVALRLPQEATYLLFAQGEAHPAWKHPQTGMSLDGIVGETIIAYALPACGDPNHPYPVGDLNKDCHVNLLDLAIIASHWLECTAPDCGV